MWLLDRGGHRAVLWTLPGVIPLYKLNFIPFVSDVYCAVLQLHCIAEDKRIRYQKQLKFKKVAYSFCLKWAFWSWIVGEKKSAEWVGLIPIWFSNIWNFKVEGNFQIKDHQFCNGRTSPLAGIPYLHGGGDKIDQFVIWRRSSNCRPDDHTSWLRSANTIGIPNSQLTLWTSFRGNWEYFHLVISIVWL